MWCCGTDIKRQGKRDEAYFRKSSVFDQKEINSLKRKFDYVKGDKAYIDRETFKKNIGFLGIRSVSGFLDRIFNSFDIDGDNKISFDDFFQYMEILKDGNDDQKAMISFNLIYLEQNMDEQRSNRKMSMNKVSQSKNNQTVKQKKQKRIDLQMFSRFFEDFFKSWSNITNLAIPKQTRNSLNHFIYELFSKVEKTGKSYITLEYYKALYKDKEFMDSFQLINSKLGNFFINSSNQSKKNVSLMHKVLRKIHNINQKCFPLKNNQFMTQYKKDDMLFYDSMRYSVESPFIKNNHQEKKQTGLSKQSEKSHLNFERNKHTEKFVTMQFQQFRDLKEELQKDRNMYRQQLYQKKLEEHVIFLQQKLLFIESKLKQIIQETKEVYQDMHQQFVKILQSFQKKKLQEQDLVLARIKKKSDKKVFFGHKNFNLVLQIMVGIQMSVRSVNGYQQMIFEEPEDFQLKHIFEMDSGRFGEEQVLYTFTDYAPNVFNHIRKIYDIENQEYINSIGPNKLMASLIMGRMASFQQLVSQGKSGSFFYHTQDGKYLIKTIPQRQFYFMRKILQPYYKYLKSNPKTLIPKFYGLHKIRTTQKQTFSVKITHYLVVMNNIFDTKDQFVQKYDLKGSWVGRDLKQKQGVKKDNDFLKDQRFLHFSNQKKVQLIKIIQKDVAFFEQNNIIDYSLLLGITKSKKQDLLKRNTLYQTETPQTKLFISTGSQKGQKDNNSKLFHLKAQNLDQSYLFGIIDILTQYNTRKKAQNCFKGCAYDVHGISAVPPDEYRTRFVDFMKKKVFRLSEEVVFKQTQKIDQKKKTKIKKNTSLQYIHVNYDL